MENCSLIDLKSYLKEMRKENKDEFNKVHKAQEKTNGRVTDIEKDQIERKAQLRIIKWGLVTTLSIITSIGTLLVVAYIKNKFGL